MEGLHLLADVAVADYQDCGNSPQKKKQKQDPRFPERNCCPLDQHAHKFIDLNMLADVASSSSSLLDAWDCSTYSSVKKKKNKKPISNSSSVNATSSCWSLQVNKSNLKLCFKKTNNSILSTTQTPKPSSSSYPIHLLAQIAFAYKTSTLWALRANSIPTKRRSTSNRRPNRKFKHVPATAIAGTKRRFADVNTSHKEVKEEEIQIKNSHKRRRETRSLPIQLSNYLATKKGTVSDPKLVIIKQLYSTDLNPQQCRFSIPINQVIDRDFLTPEDKRRLDNGEAISVTLIPPCLEEKPMHLKKWMMNGIGIYVLNKGWSSVIRNKKNRLHLNFNVELWYFTCNGGGLYFALTNGDKDIPTTICPGNGRKGDSVDFIGDDMEATSDDDESTITIQEDV